MSFIVEESWHHGSLSCPGYDELRIKGRFDSPGEKLYPGDWVSIETAAGELKGHVLGRDDPGSHEILMVREGGELSDDDDSEEMMIAERGLRDAYARDYGVQYVVRIERSGAVGSVAARVGSGLVLCHEGPGRQLAARIRDLSARLEEKPVDGERQLKARERFRALLSIEQEALDGFWGLTPEEHWRETERTLAEVETGLEQQDG